MTCIANYPTKKAFKEAVANNPERVFVDNPSIFAPLSGPLTQHLHRDGTIYVTNHPKRSWYAEVIKQGDRIIVR